MFKGGILSGSPKQKPLEVFVANLTLNNPDLDWALKPENLKRALKGQNPSDSISSLLPSDEM
jgi:hypothetical protein